MIFYLIGIDHKSASPEALEAALRLGGKIAEFWKRVNPGKAAVLTTCNRVEIYGVASNAPEAAALVESFTCVFSGSFKGAYIEYGHDKVFEHGLNLACGLKSRLKGELQISRQLEAWVDREDFPVSLKNIWGRIITIEKEIRARSGLDRGTIDIAELIFDDIKRNINTKKGAKILVIGTGKVASLIAEKSPGGMRLSFVARKKRSRAERLAHFSGGTALRREEMKSALITACAVISATSSPHYVLAANDFADAIRQRRKRPLYIYDVALPRDVAPDVSEISFVKIKNPDTLISNFYQKNTVFAAPALLLAEKLIKETALRTRTPAVLKKIRIGTRPSPLAIKQVEEIRRLLPHVSLEVTRIETKGDKDKVTPLAGIEKSDFFTHEIEKALLEGKIDASIHSAKDIEEDVPRELVIAAVTRSISPFECLVSREKLKLNELAPGSIVGTSSRKRKAAVESFRSDLVVKDIRGNIEERLNQLDKGDFDAIIIAHAALLRLGYRDRIAEIISPDIIKPHPLQGRLAVQVRQGRRDMIGIFGRIDEN